ncbi:MAG: sigma-70 family RNA polymerase sigma factor [Candidatus Nanopelagicales bacterium]
MSATPALEIRPSRGATAEPSDPARDQLIVDHIPVVGHIVRETMGRLPSHVSRDELTSAGLLALVQSARSYDPDRGVAFTAYASSRIRGAILDELRGIDWASRSVRRRSRQVEQARTSLATALGRSATDKEVAAALGIPLDAVAANNSDVARASVLALDGFGETPIEDILASSLPSPQDVVEKREQLGYLVDAIAELPERLRTVIQDYYFAARPMLDIAADLEVTESRVSQMRAEALALIRDAMNSALDPGLVAPAARPAGAAARRRNAYFAAVEARRTVTSRLATSSSLNAIA